MGALDQGVQEIIERERENNRRAGEGLPPVTALTGRMNHDRVYRMNRNAHPPDNERENTPENTERQQTGESIATINITTGEPATNPT